MKQYLPASLAYRILLIVAPFLVIGCVTGYIWGSRWILTMDGQPCGWSWGWESELQACPFPVRWGEFKAERPGHILTIVGRSEQGVEFQIDRYEWRQWWFPGSSLEKAPIVCFRPGMLNCPGPGSARILLKEPPL